MTQTFLQNDPMALPEGFARQVQRVHEQVKALHAQYHPWMPPITGSFLEDLEQCTRPPALLTRPALTQRMQGGSR
jgi:hypothetical protein